MSVSHTTRQNDFRSARFGDFVVARPIASGSLTSLYLGHRTSVRGFVQPVALHVLHPHLAHDADLVHRFCEGARRAAFVGHPNVCRVFETGAANETRYVATQYLEGETLATILRTDQGSPALRLAPELIAHIFAQAADGLYAAHTATDASGTPLRLRHGALSPRKLHISYEGQLSVLGFGMASSIDRIQSVERELLRERFAYAAPEQIRGDDLDARADVWSLGVILRESLTGARAFTGRSAAEVVHEVLNQPLGSWPGHVPGPLREIASRALALNPSDRYPNMSALSSDLRSFVAAEPRELDERLGRHMASAFSSGLELKRKLVRSISERSIDLSDPVHEDADLPECEEPTRAFFAEPSLAAAESTPPEADVSGPRTRVRLDAPIIASQRVRAAIATWRPAQHLSDAARELERRARGRIVRAPLRASFAMLLLGAALGSAITALLR